MPLTTHQYRFARRIRWVNERFERSTPLEILSWTFERFGGDVAMACSFEDLALLHMVHG